MKPSLDFDIYIDQAYEFYANYDDDDIRRLYYDPAENAMFDECGFRIVNIFDMITPNMLFLFKLKKEDMLVYGKNHEPIELLYPDPGYYD